MKIISINIMIMALLITVAGCKKADVSDPVIETVMVNGETSEVEALAGTELVVMVQLSDDRELGEFKIDIHDAFDEHGHGKMAVTKWVHQQSYSIKGQSYFEEVKVQIPADAAAGPYHFIVRLSDAVGNEAEPKEIELIIMNNTQPNINITSHDFSQEVQFVKGTTVNMTGEIIDDQDLTEVHILLHLYNGTNKMLHEAIYDEEFELTGTADLSWNFSEMSAQNKEMAIPADAESGEYELIIRAMDTEGNMTYWREIVHID